MAREYERRQPASTHELATNWNHAEMLFRVEQERYPYKRALTQIISEVFRDHVPQDSSILEVGGQDRVS